MNNRLIEISSLALICGTIGCGRQDFGRGLFGSKHKPVVAELNTETEPSPSVISANHDSFLAADERAQQVQATAASKAVSGTATFHKGAIFDREFLYGFDLQYSSGADSTLSLIPQSQSLGHIPCFFREIGDELQLVADQSRLFESQVNHPELLLSTYKIIAEDDQTVTVKFESGGLAINEAVNGKGADAPKQVWVRSLNFVEDGNYLLQESALLLKDGSIQTYMETVFPRSNLVVSDYQPIEANKDKEPVAQRYRLLQGESVYVTQKIVNGVPVRIQTAFATRFDVTGDKTIDWYVTPNAPDDLMPVFKSGVEGWNRYFSNQLGRNVMRFRGRLPEGIKIGDPRFNVINFDTVAKAGAAYESQASDPLTGVQSHSLIYMPYAWYNIGVSLWQQRVGEQQSPPTDIAKAKLSPKGTETIFGPGRNILSCVRSLDEVALNSQIWSEAVSSDAAVPVPTSVDHFGRKIMMSTLFHEVGHALGMAHNFKGSLAFDTSKAPSSDNPVTWSIMDYNFYQNEQGLFDEIGSTSGPQLEYDRQLISQLYHHGSDVKADDPVIPACEDGEADRTDGGVDPLCLRYDVDQNPMKGLEQALHNVIAVSAAQGIETKTLTEALLALQPVIASRVTESATGEAPADQEAIVTKAAKLGDRVGDLVTYYISNGAQALRNNLTNNNKALRIWSKEAKVADELAFRSQYAQILKDVASWRGLPPAPQDAVKKVADSIKAATGQIPNLSSAAESAQPAIAEKAAIAFSAAVESKVTASLSKLRASIYPTLKYDPKNLFTLTLVKGGELSHFEEMASSILASGALIGLDTNGDDAAAVHDERIAAATALVSFRTVAPTIFSDVIAKLAVLATNAQRAGDAALLAAIREVQQTVN